MTSPGGGCGRDMPILRRTLAAGGATEIVGSGGGRFDGTTIDVDVDRALLLLLVFALCCPLCPSFPLLICPAPLPCHACAPTPDAPSPSAPSSSSNTSLLINGVDIRLFSPPSGLSLGLGLGPEGLCTDKEVVGEPDV